MGISIQWSYSAEHQLEDIYNYYSFQASKRVAMKIIEKIYDRVTVLLTNPLIGQKEELLPTYSHEVRYLIVDNYKIIYWLDGSIITIAAVFDCRQNPVKLKNISDY